MPDRESSGPRLPGGPEAPLDLRDLSSTALWFAACRRASGSLSRALGTEDREQVEAGLAKCGSLLRLSKILMALGVLSRSVHQVCHRSVEQAYFKAVRQGLQTGTIVPGTTRGVGARDLLRVRVEPAMEELLRTEHVLRCKLEYALQTCFAGQKAQRIPMEDQDLEGLPENLRKVWAGGLRTYVPGKKPKYSVPADRNTITRVLPFVQRAETRRRVFEAYFNQFSTGGVHEAALDLLRVRQQLARKLGFDSWASFQLRPLATSSPDEARKLMDSCWSDALRSLAPVLRKMDELAGGAATSSPRTSAKAQALEHVKQVDEAFYRALVTRELEIVKLAEFLKADDALQGLLSVVGQAYGVRFSERTVDSGHSGWRPRTSVLEVVDSSPQSKRLGFVYVQLEQPSRWFGRPSTLPPGAVLLSPGHCFLGMNFSAASRMYSKLLNFDEVAMVAHELGHAVHMLCQSGTTLDWDDQPLDLIELPSTLSETMAMNPAVIMRYAKHHASGGPPPDTLAKSCQQAASRNILRYLQSASVSLGLHGPSFDALSATPQELLQESLALWQRYSPVIPHASFTPFGEDAGLYVSMGANHAAYLLCNARVDVMLHGGHKSRSQDVARRWLSPDFAGKLRVQLLERPFSGQRLATLMPLLVETPEAHKRGPLPHPLPPLPGGAEVAAGMVARKFGFGS